MKCENCNHNEASFFYEENINGKQKKMALCSECAAKLGLTANGSASTPFGGFGADLFDGFFEFTPATVQKIGKVCPDCGATWREIRASGKASCPKCYEAFAAELEPTLRQLHGGAVHTGRAPARCNTLREKDSKLAALREQLTAAIEKEDFESAATLRDEIRALEKE